MHDIHSLKETTGIRASQRYFSFEISGGPERTEFCVFGGRNCLRPLSADTASQLDVLGHGVDEEFREQPSKPQMPLLVTTESWAISLIRRATNDGFQACLYLWGLLTLPVAGALLRAALVASCSRGAFLPPDLRTVCLVRAIAKFSN